MEGERFGAICTLDRGKEADGARMHNAFFGPVKKAAYLLEPKLDLLTSEFFLISRSKNMIFLGKGHMRCLFAT